MFYQYIKYQKCIIKMFKNANVYILLKLIIFRDFQLKNFR